jgi:hypothetical protein
MSANATHRGSFPRLPSSPVPRLAPRLDGVRRLGVLGLALGAALAFARPAHAEEEFELHVAHGKVVVEAKEGWHINLDFPWKLVMGDVKLDKTKFALSEKVAEVRDVPAGDAKLRGAVCSKDACHTLEREIHVP